MGVGEVGDGPHVVAIAVHGRHPGNRYESGARIDERFQVLGLDDAITVPRDAELHPMPLLELSVDHERGLVVQVVDHHVVARCPGDGVGDDVLALGGGVQQGNLIRRRVDEAGELCAGGADLPEEVADVQWLEGPLLHEALAGGQHLLRDGRDVGRVEVGAAGGDGKIAADPEGITRTQNRGCGLGRRRRVRGPKGGGGRE